MASSDDLLDSWKQERTLTMEPVGNVNTTKASDQLLNSWKTDFDTRFQVSVKNAVNVNPDKAAEAQRLAKELSLPIDTVERNMDDAHTMAKTRKFDMYRMGVEDPVLAQQFTNPEFAKIAHDDYDSLSRTEKVMRWFKEIPQDAAKGWEVGRLQSEQGLLGEKAMTGQANDAMWKRIKEINEKTKDLKGTGGFTEATAKILGQMSTTMPEAIKAGEALAITGGTMAMVAGQAGPQVAVPEEIFTVPGAAVTGFIAGMTAKMAEQTYRIEAGQAYLDMVDQGIEKNIARNAGAGVGLVNAALEVFGIKYVTEPFKKALMKEVTQEVSKALVKPTTKMAVTEFGKSYGKAWAAETGTEILQEISNIAGEEIAKSFSAKEFESDLATPSGRARIAERLAGVFEEVGKGMAVLALPGASINFRGDYKRAKEAEKQTEFFSTLNESIEQSKLRERSPDAYHELIGLQASSAGVENIYVDGVRFAQAMRDAGVTAEDLAKTMPEVAAQIAESQVTGGDIIIPTADYATHIAGTDFGKTLVTHARADVDAMSVSDLKEFEQQKKDFIKQAADSAMEKNATNEEFIASAREVESAMFQQIKQTGKYADPVSRTNAQFVRDFVVTQAAAQNIMPMEFYNKYMYKVTTEGDATFSQPNIEQARDAAIATPEFKNWFGDSKVIDNQGKPSVVFHGTTKDFDEFKSGSRNRLVKGVYFSSEPDIAGRFAGDTEGAQLVPVYLSLKNPATNEDYERVLDALPYEEKKTSVQRTAALKKAGFDGLMYDISGKGKAFEYVIFDPTQVKSVFNEGTWSPETKNILKQAAQTGKETPADVLNAEEDAIADDATTIDQADIPTTVDDAAALDAALQVSNSQVWNKGRDLKMAIQNGVQQAASEAGVDVSAPSAATSEYLTRVGVRDALFALEQNPNAIGWYDEKTRQALAVMSLIHPEIATNENSRFAFVWALAVTSNGMKVDKNFELAEKAYEYYKSNGKMPTNLQAGQAQQAINKSLELFNELTDAWGMDNLRLFMQTNFTVGEISAISKDLKPGGEHADTQVKGAAIIGPKIGNGFFSNLYGDFSSLTMDRWLIRTWGRWTGTLIKSQPQHIALATTRLSDAVKAAKGEELKRLSDIVGVDIANTEVGKLSEAVQKASMDPVLRAELNKTATGEELRKSGNSLAKYLDGQKEAPAGPHERTYIRSVFNEILAELKQNPAYEQLTMADLQAVLWYAEKRLYETAKDNTVDQESTDGYSDEDAPDYANAAAAVARGKSISDRKINSTLKKESKDERARRARLQDGAAEGQLEGEQAEAGGFTQREKRLFAGAIATRIARSNRSGGEQQQWSYSQASGGDSRGTRVLKNLGVSYSQDYKAGRGLARVYRQNGIATPRFVELEQNAANATRFAEFITASKERSGDVGAAVYVYPVEEYQGMRLFLAEDGLTGVAVKPDGDIVSVFSQAGAGRSAIEMAVAAGGTKLDAFETILPEFYAAHGFVASSRLPWDDTQAPEGWNKQAFKDFNNGEPNVVFMVLDQSYQGWHNKNDGKKAKTYDDAVAEQNRAIKRIKKRKDENGKPAILKQSGTGTGGVERLRAGDFAVQQRYGEPITGSSSVIGVHYSGQPRRSLAGRAYGTGLKGAESARLQGADARLQSRVHFYVDTGNGIRPEAGVGGYVHAVNLDNLYDVTADPLGLRAAAASQGVDEGGKWFNNVESAILDAGFDGVYVPSAQGNQGVAVLLGPQHTGVPVEQFGTHSMPAAGAVERPATGKMSYPLLSSEIRQFSEQEQAIRAAAPSAVLKNGSLTFDETEQAAIMQFFPQAARAQQLRQETRGGFDPSRLTTILNEKTDYSTFLHETAHFFLTVYGDMAAQANAPQQVKDDMQMLLDWFGVKDIDAWNAMSLEEQRKYHEQFAYSYEIYLFEGKAPSIKMQTLFDRFSAWLRRVYTSIRDDLNEIYKQEHGTDLPIMTGEVKQVMDRMLASNEQIQQAEQVRNMVPMYQTQDQANMNDSEWAAYQEMVREATDAASADLTNASMRQMKWLANARSRVLKEMQKQTADTRKKVRAEVEEEVRNDPVYKAMNWLKRGETTDAQGNEIKAEAGYKLSLEAVKAMYPESKSGLAAVPDYKKLGYGQYGMLSEEGLHPDIVAGMFGFKSGDALVRSLLDAKKFSEEVEARTDQRMLDEYGEMQDPKSIEIAVERALHNEARARFVAVELRHMAKATRPVRIMLEAAKQAAKQLLSNKPIATIKPRDYALAEARAAKLANDMMKNGMSSEAVQAKQQQLLNNQLASEAIKANTEVAKALEFFKKVFGKDEKLAKSRDMNMVSAARAILANYGLGSTEQGAAAYLDKIKAYDPEFYAEIEPMITAHQQVGKPISQLTYDEFIDVRDQVQALWHLSKRSRTMEIDGKLIERDEAVKELNARIDVIDTTKERAGYDRAMSDWDKRKIMLMGARAAMRRVESWVDAMDSGKIDGPFRKYIWTPVSEAVAKYRTAKNDYLQQYLDIIKSVEKGLTGASITAPEIGYEFKNKAELLHAILHTGNESNKRKLLLGREWASINPDGSIDTSMWDMFLNRMYQEGTLTKQDYDFAQKIWDLLEKMKPAAQKVHRDMYGFYFAEITANAIETPFGIYKGGYVPAVSDPWINSEAAVRNEQETQATDNSYMFPTTGRGFTKGRVDYNKPLILDLGYLPSHIDKVLRFTFIEPRIKDVAKIVKTNKSFAAALDQLDPTLRGDMLMPWLQRTAQQMIQTPMKGMGGKLAHKFFSEIRNRTGAQLMVANITNALQQITGISIAAIKVAPKHLRNATWLYTRQPTDTANMVSEKSEYMRTRMSNSQFEIAKTIDELLLNPSKYDKLRDFAGKHGYFMQQGMQNLVDTIVWVGAYNQEMIVSKDEKSAVRAADSAVRQTQGSFSPEDVSRFETGNAFVRAFTMFYSYFNMQANLLGTEFTKIVREFGVKKGMGQLLYIYTFGFMIPAVMAEIIVQAAGGFDDGDDDEWDQYDAMSLFFGSQARTALAMVPVAGPAALSAFNMWNKKPYDDRISTSPSISALEQTIRAPKSLYDAIAEDKSWKKAVRDTLTALGMITGLPLGQLGKPLGYAADVAQGKVEPQSAGDIARGVVSGKDVNRKD